MSKNQSIIFQSWKQKIRLICNIIKADNKQLNEILKHEREPKNTKLSHAADWVFVMRNPWFVPKGHNIVLTGELKEIFINVPLLDYLDFDEAGQVIGTKK